MRELVAAAVRRAMDGGDAGGLVHPHRLPMGLTLVEQGKITARQLREALEGQRRAAEEGGERMRLGEWLLKSGVLGEPALTRALGAQWNCPVFSLDGYRPQELASALPRFLSDALGALPVRAPGGTQLHVAFSGRVDRTLSYALERMTGLKVVAGVARDSEFVAAQGRCNVAVIAIASTSILLIRNVFSHLPRTTTIDRLFPSAPASALSR